MSVYGAFDSVRVGTGGILGRARDFFRILWSQAPRRETGSWLEYYHTSPMLDPIHMIANDVANATFKIHNKVSYRTDALNAKPVGNHPIFDVFELPMPNHPEVDMGMIWYLTEVYFDAVGEAFWIIDTDTAGSKPRGLLPVPPNWVLETPTESSPYYYIAPIGNTTAHGFKVDARDMVWFKSPNAANPYGRGRGRAEAIGDEVETHEYSTKYAKNLFYNDGVPPLILEMPGIGKDEANEFKENWMQKIAGYMNAHKPAIVNKKDFKVHQLVTSNKEMDFLESRKFLIQSVYEHWSVPPEMRGNTQNSNRATIDSAYYLWAKNVTSKRLNQFARVINTQLMPRFDKTSMFVFDNVVPEDEEFLLKKMTEGLKAGTVLVDEWRTSMKLKPDPKGGQFYLRSFGMVAVPANTDPTETEPEPEPPDGKEIPPKGHIEGEGKEPTEEEIEEEDGAPNEEEVSEEAGEEKLDLDSVIKALEELNSKGEEGYVPDPTPPERLPHMEVEPEYSQEEAGSKAEFSIMQKEAIWKLFDANAQSMEKPFVEASKRIAKFQRGKVRSAINSLKSQDEKAVKAAIDRVFTSKADKIVSDYLSAAWVGTMQKGRDHALETLGGEKGYRAKDATGDVTNKRFAEWVRKYGLLKAKEINDTTHEALLRELQKVLSDSVDQGDGLRVSIKKLLEACDGIYDNMSKTRAETIARTESCSSVNYGAKETYKSEGIEKKDWLSTPDDRTRDAHRDVKGPVGIDEDFTVGGEKLSYPGDPKGSAGNVIDCRCTIIPVV